jgi:hypothetical protein
MRYDYTASFQRYNENDTGGWYFLFMPKELAKIIRESYKWREEGWGRMKITAQIGNSEWKTSIWFDTKHDTYLLPVKAEIRKKEKIIFEVGHEVMVTLWI